MERAFALALVGGFIAFLAFLTFAVLGREGVTVRVIIGLAVLAVVLVGVWGAIGGRQG